MNRKTTLAAAVLAAGALCPAEGVRDMASQDQLYRSMQPEKTSRVRENVEWTITYAYNARDTKNPRVLLIGDSICNQYQGRVRSKLGKEMNVTFWATSKCVTDPDYFRELSLILNQQPCQVISFNNGLHSLGTDRKEWEKSFRQAVRFIRKAKPEAELFITLSTPLRPAAKTALSAELNTIARRIAEEEKIPVLDLFTPLKDLDRKTYWNDDYHFKDAGSEMLANMVADAARKALPAGKKNTENLKQSGTATGPSGALR